MPPLFCYGTLQLPLVMQAVVGRSHKGQHARLPGYARLQVADADYPGIVACPSAETDGVLYEDIEKMELAILDRFEGELYTRTMVKVVLKDGGSADAWAYVITKGFEERLSAEPWRLDRFLASGLSRFMRSYVEKRKAEFL